jgi:hypothetical protein
VLVAEDDEEQEVELRKLNEEVEDIDVGDDEAGEDGGGRCLISASCGEESDGDHGGEETSEYRAARPSCGLGGRLDRWPELTERGMMCRPAVAVVEESIVLSWPPSVGESLRSVA